MISSSHNFMTKKKNLRPAGIPALATTPDIGVRVCIVAVILLVETLLGCRCVGIAEAAFPAVLLAALSVCVHTAVVLAFAGIFAAWLRLVFRVRGTLVGVCVGVELEAVASFVV